MELTTIINGSNIYDFIRGPMVWIACVVFLLGILYQVFSFLSMTEKKDKVLYNPRPRKKIKPSGFNRETILRAIAGIKLSIVGVNPVMLIVTSVFHICLVLAPIFLLAHNVLLDTYIGISGISFSEKTSDYMTMILLACVAFFLYRRIFVARVRAITTVYDYIMLFLAAAPFITGFFAYHQYMVEHYKVIIALHILSGELMLMAVPFTKFVHMVFFFIFRFTIESEYSIGAGNRNW